MTEPIPGGRRRVDRVLSADFLAGVEDLSLEDLRARRHDAEQEDADLSYIRRLLQARMDILRAEQRTRAAAAPAGPPEDTSDLVERLTEVLGGGERPAAYGMGRHATIEPSRVAESRRRVEQLLADPHLSDLASLSDAELAQAVAEIAAHEARVSETRRRVQHVMAALTAEVGRRYRDGETSVDELLAHTPAPGDAGPVPG